MTNDRLLGAIKIISKDYRPNTLEVGQKSWNGDQPWELKAKTIKDSAVKELVEAGYSVGLTDGMVEIRDN
tara:strand:- start:363 stop:572 length:210 start_codon:yes stop_codon:yes gene_type:complete